MKKNIHLYFSRPASFLAILALVFLNLAYGPLAQAAGNSTLSFSPSTRSIATGASTTLDAVVNPGPTPHHVSSVSARITYNQTKLNLTGITCSSTFGTELFKNIPSTPDGTARIDCAIPGANPSVTTTTTVATFSFTALATVSNSPVAFTAQSSIGADDALGVNVFDGDIVTGAAAVTVTTPPDVTPPTFTINDGASGSYVQSDTINVTVADASGLSGSPTYGFSADNTCNGSDTINTAFTSGSNFNIAGDHSDYLCLKATDNSSNHNIGYQLVGQLHTDNTAPNFTVNDGASASPVKTDTINVTVADGASGVSTRTYGFSADNICNASDTLTTAFASGSNFNIVGDHADYLCLKSIDNAGNTGYQLVGQLHTDNTPPTVSQVTPVPATGYDATPDYVFNAAEGGTVAYGGDCSTTSGGAVNSGSNTATFSALSIGNHSNCTIRVTDAAGNQSSFLNVPTFAVTYRADFNLDHAVDNLDYTFWHNYYNTANATADTNSDGVVDNLDYASLHSVYSSSF